jgi:hypothetical protein
MMKAIAGSVPSDPIPSHAYWAVTGMAEIGSVGGGRLESAGAVPVSVDDAGSLFSAGVIGAVSGGGVTGSAAAGVGCCSGCCRGS